MTSKIVTSCLCEQEHAIKQSLKRNGLMNVKWYQAEPVKKRVV